MNFQRINVIKLNLNNTYEMIELNINSNDDFFTYIESNFYTTTIITNSLIGDNIKILSDDWGTEMPICMRNIQAEYFSASKFQIRGAAFLVKIKNIIKNNTVIDTKIEYFTDEELNLINKIFVKMREKNFNLLEKLGYE